MEVNRGHWRNAATAASNLSESELLVGAVAAAVTGAEQSVDYADRSGNEFQMMASRTTHSDALHAAGRREPAERLFADAEQRQKKRQFAYPQLYSMPGYRYCDLLLSKGENAAARDRATQALEWAKSELGIRLPPPRRRARRARSRPRRPAPPRRPPAARLTRTPFPLGGRCRAKPDG